MWPGEGTYEWRRYARLTSGLVPLRDCLHQRTMSELRWSMTAILSGSIGFNILQRVRSTFVSFNSRQDGWPVRTSTASLKSVFHWTLVLLLNIIAGTIRHSTTVVWQFRQRLRSHAMVMNGFTFQEGRSCKAVLFNVTFWWLSWGWLIWGKSEVFEIIIV